MLSRPLSNSVEKLGQLIVRVMVVDAVIEEEDVSVPVMVKE
jgi:hypothetical protein